MFYEHPSFKREAPDPAKIERALVTLNPSESKRLIARAIPVLPEMKAALKKGTVVIGWGTTNALILEEILGKKLDHKTDFASGVVSEGELNANHTETKIFPYVFKDGKVSELHQKAALVEFRPGDIFIKGANAVDAKGDIGILLAAQSGGSLYDAWYAVTLRGGLFICAVGLEKMVPSVSEVAEKCGFFRFKYSMGAPLSYVTFSTARVVTEIQAIRVLSGAIASHVASGGIAGSEGAVTLVLEAEALDLQQAFDLIKSVKGEPPIPPPRKYGSPPAASLGYDPVVISDIINQQITLVPPSAQK